RALARLGVVFQQQALDLDLSVRANLLFHADLHGMPRPLARTRIAAQLEALGLAESESTRVRNLSGGQRRKVELARALLHAPRILLMDEATVGLDPASRQQLIEAVHLRCRTHGLAVLWATHLIDEVHRAARFVLLQHGEIRFDGALEEFPGRAPGESLSAALLRALAVTAPQ
ncbi:MAG: ATP-binding cassette domain-containing protein, partial [Casimicrobiaceae bacterium]